MEIFINYDYPRPFAVKSIAAADVDMVIIGTPIDLTRVIKINKPSQRVRYELQEIGQPTLEGILKAKFGK